MVGTGGQGSSGDEGPAANALLFKPISVSVDTSGNVYIADTGNNKIRKVSLQFISDYLNVTVNLICIRMAIIQTSSCPIYVSSKFMICT